MFVVHAKSTHDDGLTIDGDSLETRRGVRIRNRNGHDAERHDRRDSRNATIGESSQRRAHGLTSSIDDSRDLCSRHYRLPKVVRKEGTYAIDDGRQIVLLSVRARRFASSQISCRRDCRLRTQMKIESAQLFSSVIESERTTMAASRTAKMTRNLGERYQGLRLRQYVYLSEVFFP